MPSVKKKHVMTGRRIRVDLKKVRCARCQKKIGDHASFMLMHVINAANTKQHGLIPICGPCFTETVGSVSATVTALRDLIPDLPDASARPN